MEDRTTVVNQIIKKVMKKVRTIIPEHNLVEDLGLNSIQFMELISELENYYDIIVPIQKLQSVKKVKDIYEFVNKIEYFCEV